MSDELKNSGIKTSVGWLEVADYDSNPTDTDSLRAGIAVVSGSLMVLDAGGSWSSVSAGSATAYDDITDPDANGTIAFTSYSNSWTTTMDGGTVFDIYNTDTALASNTYLLDLKYKDDADANGIFFRCLDNSGADVKFKIEQDGKTTIAGNAAGTDAFALTTGDIALADGNIDMAEGKIEVDTTADETSYFKRNNSGASSAVVEIEATNTGDTGSVLLLDQNGTGNVKALEITHDGDYAAIDISAGAARTGNVISIAMANQLAETALDITGAATGTASEGIIHVDVTGALAGNAIRVDSTGTNATTGQLIYALSSGNLAGATSGACAYFEETGNAQATTYAVYISSTNNEALKVDAGTVVFDESLSVGTTLAVTGISTFSESLDVTIADSGNNTCIYAIQNDVTNNPDAVHVDNSGTGDALFIDQDGEGIAISIDSEATTVNIIDVEPTTLTTGYMLSADDADALTTGGFLELTSNSTDTSARNLVAITNSNAAAVGANCLFLDNDADSAAYALEIDRDSSDANTVWAMKIDSDNAGAGAGGGIDFSAMGQDEPILKAVADATDPTGSGGAGTGQIAVDIGGSVVYLAYY